MKKRKKAAQEAAATQFSMGYWWNEQFKSQRVWLENGQQMNNSEVRFSAHTFVVKAGSDE